jgi:hypothetical protein
MTRLRSYVLTCLRTAFLLVQVPEQGTLDDVLVAETTLEGEPPKPLILCLRQTERQGFGARFLPCGNCRSGRGRLGRCL